MNLDICIPVWKNLKCLQMAALGWKHTLQKTTVPTFLLHITDLAESIEALDAFAVQGLFAKVVSCGTGVVEPPFEFMNRLFRASTSPWLIMTEQDFFPVSALDWLVQRLDNEGFAAGAPLDTMLIDHPNAKSKAKYGRYTRLSPDPGYFHSSLMLINRERFAKKSSSPFTVPEGFRFHGYGAIGAEQYYGLRLTHGPEAKSLAFFRQLHASYGYAAEIKFMNSLLGFHLFYSSRYTSGHGIMDADELAWLSSEEDRFLSEYPKMVVL